MSTQRNVICIKGFCYGIPKTILEAAYQTLIRDIVNNHVTSIMFDGDLLTYANNMIENSEPVKSYTLVINELKKWSSTTGYNLEFIIAKKQKSIYKLMNGAPIEADSHGTILGPYEFINNSNTTTLSSNDKLPDLQFDTNFAVGMDNNIHYTQLGVTFMKWIKMNGINDVTIYTLGQGDIVSKELALLKSMGSEVPNINVKAFQFERDSIA